MYWLTYILLYFVRVDVSRILAASSRLLSELIQRTPLFK